MFMVVILNVACAYPYISLRPVAQYVVDMSGIIEWYVQTPGDENRDNVTSSVIDSKEDNGFWHVRPEHL